MNMKTLSTLLVFSGCSLSAWAQCGNGVPAAGNPGCIPPDKSNSPYYQGGDNAPSRRSPQIVYSPRWGAIAYDKEANVFSTAENDVSQSSAEKSALSRCSGSNCKIINSYRNQCGAFAGGIGFYGHARGVKLNDAEIDAKKECESNGVSCKILYSGCSMPVRVQ